MFELVVRSTALGSVAAIALLSAAPGYAAAPVGESSATAFRVVVAGEAADSGGVTASAPARGAGQTTDEQPPLGLLDGQGLLNAGEATQQASASAEGRRGRSVACAGLAGEGGSVAQVGDSDCLTPGQPVDVSVANLDLTGVEVFREDSVLAGLNAVTRPLVATAIGPITAAISDGVSELGTVGIGGTLGAVQSRCRATPGEASGTATLADSELTADVGGTSVVLLDLPAEPRPGTEVVTDLDEVVGTVLTGLQTDLRNSLDGTLAGGVALTDAVRTDLVDTIVADVGDQLQPLEDNLLRATLNQQTRTPDGIEVTALALDVLPAAVDHRATRTVTLTEEEVAARATELFGQDRRGGRLVLVSCTDWVDGDYRSNVVVFADPVRAPARAA